MKLRVTVLCLFLVTFSFGQTLPEINTLIGEELKSAKLPAIAVAVIDSGKVIHLSAHGFRDWNAKSKATTSTPFHIASVSKIVTNLAIFKLVESGSVDLTADINEYLPFEVKNPHYPSHKITVRELLNHRSGIRDNPEIYDPLWSEPNGDPKTELAIFLTDYLNREGKLYKKDHFDSSADYKSFSYSNTGVALLGLIVETVSESGFEEFCQQNIFKPLSMKNTSWFLKNLDSSKVAKTYVAEGGNGPLFTSGFQFKGHNGYPDYPAGQLRTSIADFSSLLVGYLTAENATFILKKKTTNKITPSPQISQEGYYTWFLKSMGDRLYYSHGGGDTGVRTVAAIDVNNKNGVVIFANAEYDLERLLKGITKKMWGE